jgi:hypothetical protein
MPTATAKKTTARKKTTPKAAAPAPVMADRMPARHVKCPDSVWTAAGEQAKHDGYSGISELIRDLLRDYNAGKRMG